MCYDKISQVRSIFFFFFKIGIVFWRRPMYYYWYIKLYLIIHMINWVRYEFCKEFQITLDGRLWSQIHHNRRYVYKIITTQWMLTCYNSSSPWQTDLSDEIRKKCSQEIRMIGEPRDKTATQTKQPHKKSATRIHIDRKWELWMFKVRLAIIAWQWYHLNGSCKDALYGIGYMHWRSFSVFKLSELLSVSLDVA